MEKSRVKFGTRLENPYNTARVEKREISLITQGIGMAHAVVGAVILLVKANPLNPLSHIRF